MKNRNIMTQILRQVKLPEEVIPKILNIARQTILEDGEHLVSIGQNWNSMIILISGCLRFYYIGSDYNEVNKHFMFKTRCAAPVWNDINLQPSEFCIASIGRSVLYQVNYTELQKILKSADCTTFYIEMLSRVLEHKIGREKMQITMTPEERYLHLLATWPEEMVKIPLKHIASFIGITNVSLSRIRAKLKNVAQKESEE